MPPKNSRGDGAKKKNDSKAKKQARPKKGTPPAAAAVVSPRASAKVKATAKKVMRVSDGSNKRSIDVINMYNNNNSDTNHSTSSGLNEGKKSGGFSYLQPKESGFSYLQQQPLQAQVPAAMTASLLRQLPHRRIEEETRLSAFWGDRSSTSSTSNDSEDESTLVVPSNRASALLSSGGLVVKGDAEESHRSAAPARGSYSDRQYGGEHPPMDVSTSNNSVRKRGRSASGGDGVAANMSRLPSGTTSASAKRFNLSLSLEEKDDETNAQLDETYTFSGGGTSLRSSGSDLGGKGKTATAASTRTTMEGMHGGVHHHHHSFSADRSFQHEESGGPRTRWAPKGFAARSAEADAPFFHHLESMTPLRVRIGVVPLPTTRTLKGAWMTTSATPPPSSPGQTALPRSTKHHTVHGTTATTRAFSPSLSPPPLSPLGIFSDGAIAVAAASATDVSSLLCPVNFGGNEERDGKNKASHCQDRDTSASSERRDKVDESVGNGVDSPRKSWIPGFSFVDRFLNPKKFFQLPASSRRAGEREEAADVVGWAGVYSELPVCLPGATSADASTTATSASSSASKSLLSRSIKGLVGARGGTSAHQGDSEPPYIGAASISCILAP